MPNKKTVHLWSEVEVSVELPIAPGIWVSDSFLVGGSTAMHGWGRSKWGQDITSLPPPLKWHPPPQSAFATPPRPRPHPGTVGHLRCSGAFMHLCCCDLTWPSAPNSLTLMQPK